MGKKYYADSIRNSQVCSFKSTKCDSYGNSFLKPKISYFLLNTKVIRNNIIRKLFGAKMHLCEGMSGHGLLCRQTTQSGWFLFLKN